MSFISALCSDNTAWVTQQLHYRCQPPVRLIDDDSILSRLSYNPFPIIIAVLCTPSEFTGRLVVAILIVATFCLTRTVPLARVIYKAICIDLPKRGHSTTFIYS